MKLIIKQMIFRLLLSLQIIEIKAHLIQAHSYDYIEYDIYSFYNFFLMCFLCSLFDPMVTINSFLLYDVEYNL